MHQAAVAGVHVEIGSRGVRNGFPRGQKEQFDSLGPEQRPAWIAVFVFAAKPLGDGGVALRIVSTTVLGIQRYTTTRLKYQGVHIANPPSEGLLMETLRAHYRAHQQDTLERFMSVGSGIPLRWTKSFPNGAGDLASPSEFVIADPDLAELEELFSLPDPRFGTEGGDEEI